MNYEDFVKTTDVKAGQHDIEFYFDGMREENGEISGILKRVRRGDYGEGAQKMLKEEGMLFTIQAYTNIMIDLIKEIGDEHWYQTRALQEIGLNWDIIEKANMEKLEKRKATNTIIGKGDDRELGKCPKCGTNCEIGYPSQDLQITCNICPKCYWTDYNA